MNPLRTSLLVIVCGLLLCAAGCGTTTSVATVWKSPEPIARPFTKVVAIVVNASPAERRAGEDELARAFSGGRGVPSYTLIPDADLKNREKVREIVTREGFDGAAVIRLVSTDRKSTYIPPSYGSGYDPFHYHSAPVGEVRPGYTVTDTYITAESSLYSVQGEKLLWAGSSTTVNPDSIGDLVSQVCRSAVAELKKQGMIK